MDEKSQAKNSTGYNFQDKLNKTVVETRRNVASGLRWFAGMALVLAGFSAAATQLPPNPATPYTAGTAVVSTVVAGAAAGLSHLVDVPEEKPSRQEQLDEAVESDRSQLRTGPALERRPERTVVDEAGFEFSEAR